jgi:subtilase family serine protease
VTRRHTPTPAHSFPTGAHVNQWRHIIRRTLIAVLAIVASCSAAGLAAAATPSVQQSACARPSGPDGVRCSALVRNLVRRQVVTTPQGYGPAQLRAAYGLTSLALTNPTTTQTVGIVDAFSDPHLASDIAAYRSHFGLPACTTSTKCLRIVGQNGSSQLPDANAAWGLETTLDAEMVSAICPNCRIVVVEASSATYDDLGAAENQAVTLGARVVTNSWGGSDTRLDATFDARYFNHPGVAIVASTGDSGYAAGPIYPSTSPNVIAVGGTTLMAAAGTARGYSESAWQGAGSGCSVYEPMPAWQAAISSVAGTCGTHRAVSDVSAVADPATGVAVYDTYGYPGWYPGMIGGTSVAAPIVAGVYALAGHGAGTGVSGAAGLYAAAHTAAPANSASAALFDVAGGANGTCAALLACTAATGWDGPTGLGSPSGIAGF